MELNVRLMQGNARYKVQWLIPSQNMYKTGSVNELASFLNIISIYIHWKNVRVIGKVILTEYVRGDVLEEGLEFASVALPVGAIKLLLPLLIYTCLILVDDCNSLGFMDSSGNVHGSVTVWAHGSHLKPSLDAITVKRVPTRKFLRNVHFNQTDVINYTQPEECRQEGGHQAIGMELMSRVIKHDDKGTTMKTTSSPSYNRLNIHKNRITIAKMVGIHSGSPAPQQGPTASGKHASSAGLREIQYTYWETTDDAETKNVAT
ncbi:LOW QUALITY PROTEIN: hypothetical protein MAR_001117 [Mya arenaria]|uniref:Uncharacterized protein n=1 Tax=Mya arenaria TaxID=6604 RepID=A0ABY7FEI6_MYAAR|nr:LOW QUALITY PROTEIN: hypothetical protein MAR_001117 [Mya arenaria]